MNGRILGIDYGTKRVGVAMSDESGTLAFPKTVLQNNADLVATLTALCKEEDVSAIVLGESKNFSGEDNPVMRDIREFKEALQAASGLAVYFEPEFLTSVEARRDTARDGLYDARAAALILQRFLDKSR